MELDWSTFLLEIVNFLILIWILKHFLYRPVRASIEARRERVAAALEQAEAARAEAEQARAGLEAQREALAQERGEARAGLERELAAERERRLTALAEELEREREKAQALAERERTETERRTQEAALALAGRFAGRLLGAIASPELEAQLIDLVIDQLPDLPEQRREDLATAVAHNDAAEVQVQSAYPVTEYRRQALADALRQAAGQDVACSFSLEPALIAGLSIDAGALLLGANLRDELRFFAEAGQ
ncbi:MAG: F0F1 ATP synthase subunit delta [Thiohalocapsa sp.]|jgi:F-type H+-transporting ATPase subunit b|uniref:F0F1 ATP synthase subunit delta n=1 Tax=Thiohalocapsa sp. TaxID=2497641 RepID=UPI0025F9AAD1|nr:F0F1 ATP synthase subunit delta [Thiohalocapsa sp.]MCG6942660.1 F0F1 ATP synthase subunit delta [Thiohalocapsa sp.]